MQTKLSITYRMYKISELVKITLFYLNMPNIK